MDFKRIECIFLLVFVAINIFLFVEIFQAPKLLNGGHTVNVQNNDLKNEVHIPASQQGGISNGF